MDCGDYANEAIEREIPELLVALVAGKARPESTQHGRSGGTRTTGRRLDWREPDFTGPSQGPEILEGILRQVFLAERSLH